MMLAIPLDAVEEGVVAFLRPSSAPPTKNPSKLIMCGKLFGKVDSI